MKYIKLITLLIFCWSTASAQNSFPEPTGNVGIGTDNPSTLLQLRKDIGTAMSVPHTYSNDISGIRFSNLSTASGAGVVLNFQLGATGTSHAAIAASRPSADNNILHFYTEHANSIAERMRISSDGKVGIGTIAPFSGTSNTGLHISKGAHSSVLLGDPKSGYGGIIQTSDARQRVFIGANLYDDQSGAWSSFQTGKGSAGISLIADEGDWGTEITFITSQSDGHYNRSMKILGNGNVGIGINYPDSKLVVDGKITSEEVKVEIINGPDYVFEPDYELRTLQETKEYISENKHLPEIPSAKEMEANGIDLGEMNMRLLKKIEELTLYQIELLERLEQLESKNAEIDELKKKIETLENKVE